MWDLLGRQMIEIHVQEMLHPAATERLAREGDMPTRRERYGPWRRWLGRLGQFLIGVGWRLQRIGLPPAVAMEDRVSTERRIGA